MFYILNSPCKKGSYNPVKLESYGWKNPWHGKALKNLIDIAAGFTEKTYFYASYDGYRVERNGETYIPARAFAESCNIYGENIMYNEESDIVTLIAPKNGATLPFETLSFYGNGNSLFVNGQEFWIGAPTFEEGGTTYIPIAALNIININIFDFITPLLSQK